MKMRRASRKQSRTVFSETVRRPVLGRGRHMRPSEADAKSSRELKRKNTSPTGGIFIGADEMIRT